MSNRVFAVIPAAGLSRRMGQPKLLLPYHGTTILGSLLQTLAIPQIEKRYVVTRCDDRTLQNEATTHGGDVLFPPVDPSDMRASVEFAVQHLLDHDRPQEDDGWLLIPADHPVLSAELLGELLAIWESQRPQILVPTYEGRRGHPTLFRGSTLAWVKQIPKDQGINWLLHHFADQVLEFPCRFPEVTQDLDTPEDYDRMLNA